jgi:hypothetical protein
MTARLLNEPIIDHKTLDKHWAIAIVQVPDAHK